VSPWFSDHLQLVMSPEAIIVERMTHQLNVFSRRHASRSKVTVKACRGGNGRLPWQDAIAALAVTIKQIDATGFGRARTTVILSNHFVRYALMPWSALIDDEKEELALGRHCLREIYGPAADRWELRIAPQKRGVPRLVSAVEPELLEALRNAFAGTSIPLVSIQPWLMTICNRHRHVLEKQDGWLALVEPGALCMLLLQAQRMTRLRQYRLNHVWPVELITALEREHYLTSQDEQIKNVLLVGLETEDQPFPPGLAWNLRWLELTSTADPKPAGNDGLALSVGD